MIVVDSSALIAILEHESDAALFAAAIQKADRLLVSAVNVHVSDICLPKHFAAKVSFFSF
jgi:ribonuclease VapC